MNLAARFAALRPIPSALIAAAAGALAATGFQPVATIAGPILGFAILIGLLAGHSRRRALATGFLFGWAHFMVGLTWIATAFTFQAAMPAWMGMVAVVGLSAFLALYPMLAAFLARSISPRIVPLSLTLAALFTIAEMLRGLLFSGFAWNPLGAAWLQLEGVTALAAVIGANGLSALAILCAGSLAALLFARGQRGRVALAAFFPFILLLAVLVPAARPALPAGPGQSVLLVQPDISQAQKQGTDGFDHSLNELGRLTAEGLSRDPGVAAVIWPEAAVEYPLEESPALAARLASLLGPRQILLTGGVAIERDDRGSPTGARNSLYALDSSGRILMRYDKAHLVPGGEYLPLRWLAEPLGLSRVVPGSLDFIPGTGAQTFHLPGFPSFGPAICYEIIFAGAIVDRAARPAFILTISNDAWFGPSGPPQHHAQARLRAAEEGLPVVRVTPTGITGMIGPRGELLETLPAHQPGVLAAPVPPALAPTPFARIGLLAPALLALLLLGLGILCTRRT